MTRRLIISPDHAARLLGAAVVLVIVASALGEVSRAFAGSAWPVVRFLRELREWFNPSTEQTVGTWLTAALLFGCALLLLAIGALNREQRRGHWRLLGWLFVFLSADETISIHERAGDGVADLVDAGGFFLWAWVIPYGILALGVAMGYLPFLRRLPQDTRRRFVIAGAIYVGGALGVEMIEAWIVDQAGHGTMAVAVLAVIEEALELIGAAYFLIALLHHIAHHLPAVISFEPDDA